MTRHEMNETLFDVADWRLRGEAEKQAFVPQGATDPAAAMGGGMPPGGAPPMDPAAMGGAPPMDPAMAGMPPGGAPPMDPMAAAAAPPAAPAAGAPAAGGKPKIDPTFIYQELSRVRKLLTHMMKHTGIEMPPDILDDGTVAMLSQGQPPQSAPIGQGGESEQAGQLPAIGGQAPVSPIEPAGGTEKPAADADGVMSLFRAPAAPEEAPDFDDSARRIDALSALSRGLTGA